MFRQDFWKNQHHQWFSQANEWVSDLCNHLSYSKLSILKVLSEDLQDHSNNNNMKDKQEKLSRIQFLKINHIAENHK